MTSDATPESAISADAATTAKTLDLGAIMDEALARHRAGDVDAAAALYVRLLQLRPGSATVWTNLGAARRSQGKLDAAIACHTRAIFHDPKNESAKANLCNALRDSARYREARTTALVQHAGLSTGRPEFVARDLAGMGHWRASLEAFDRAIKQSPDDGEMRLLRATSHFMLGDFDRGFADYAWRFVHSPASEPTRRSPRWRGGKVKGKRVLVINEQGLGDAVLVSRFLPALKEKWPEVWVGARKPTRRLFEGLPFVDAVFDRNELPKEGAEDAYLPSMDLMSTFKLSPNTCPPPLPLAVPEDSRERAGRMLKPFEPFFRIGIAWAGSPTFVNAARKAADLSHFLDLATIPRVQLFGLSKGEAERDIARLGAEALIVNTAAGDRDLADAAAVIEKMDLIVTVDTSIAHLTGALGKPVWVLLPRPCFWYWGPSGEASWWYPTMRLFRQIRPNDWSDPFALIRADLENMLL